MIKDRLTMDILNKAENALAECEYAHAVLEMWLDGMPGDEKSHAEASRVGAVMTLIGKGLTELHDAINCFQTHITQD
ncbi:hypothetical protein AABH71_005113 [Salmonella enterica]|uniref:hypothetical protein n=1 Tax=Salmonella enterica TaxID=28901 RepID=UPI0012F20D97|nr:hypothetical protein [Salmonella enterica]EBQ9004524.1 hypothetical protein [Salmonella enterica subsp. enterica serovar Blockley]ECS7526344.1 hypothetical protein [Salmonella enterica]ECW2125702.1 hypothetical protein [Salmonella enterica]